MVLLVDPEGRTLVYGKLVPVNGQAFLMMSCLHALDSSLGKDVEMLKLVTLRVMVITQTYRHASVN